MKTLITSSLNFVLAFVLWVSPFVALSARTRPIALPELVPQTKPTEIKISDWKLLDAGEASKRIGESRAGKAGAGGYQKQESFTVPGNPGRS